MLSSRSLYSSIVTACVRTHTCAPLQQNKQIISSVGIFRNMSTGDKFKLPKRLGKGEESIWNQYIRLAAEYKPKANLGQGFPDFHPPEHIRKALSQIAVDPNPFVDQYARGLGHVPLVNALAKLHSSVLNREINPLTEVLVTVGAYEALYCTILGHVDQGDEVIVMEPFFDCYEVMIRMAGGTPVFIPLLPKEGGGSKSSDWVLDEDKLRSLFNSKTKMIIFNTPHNPIGKVFTERETKMIADLCVEFNVLCVFDEVYQWMVYGDHKHVRIATLPGMWERTISIGSAGKTFSATGWKIGWAYGPQELLNNLTVVHQNCVYTCSTPIQEAIARGLEHEMTLMNTPECYFNSLPQELLKKRDRLVKTLQDVGFKPVCPDGSYFVVADFTELEKKVHLSSETDREKDVRFSKQLLKQSGVMTIPVSAFYTDEHKHLGENYARFCFIKKDEHLAIADKELRAWSSK